MSVMERILKEAAALSPSEKARLIDQLIFSLDRPDAEIDRLWAEEAESRLEAYEKRKLKAVPLEKVLEKYGR
jgi:putative addiction module component (TIGR02574 family)